MRTIKAAVCHEFGQPLQIEYVQLAPPGPGEVQVDLVACAICHSDIAFADGIWDGDLPAVYGHEAAGHVAAVGEGVTGVKIGDPVLATLIRACGCCAPCAGGKPVLCNSPSTLSPLKTANGDPLSQGMAIGAFAEAVTVHQSQVVVIPDSIPMASASLLACGVITGVGAVVNAGGLRPGEDVVVIGAGGVGLNAIQGARIAGARRIVAVDLNEDKLDAALDFGATDAVLASGEAPWSDVKAAIGRGADLVAVTVGAIPAYNLAPRYLAAGGRIVMVGMPASEAEASYIPVNFAAVGQGMVGSKMGDVVLSRDIPWLVDIYGQGRLKLDELVSATYSLDRINAAIIDAKAGGARRNVILFDEG
ncbi:MAG: alcohol dehydrogenase catalytic domain-containing protein [Rhodobacteraceae bacterium]|nr:alcohol dehydrogenase catalytic domain-containing protein [Paracoccaceae bacterium]